MCVDKVLYKSLHTQQKLKINKMKWQNKRKC